jgi:iron complex outermembrane receptor protein
VGLVVDNQFANAASTIERGLNASSRYNWSTAYGQFDVWFAGQYLLADRIRTAVFAQELTADNAIGEPPKFKARGGINWTSDALLADLTLNYVNAYQNTLFTPSQRIKAWTTADLSPGRTAIPFDGANASPVGRLISLQFKKRW